MCTLRHYHLLIYLISFFSEMSIFLSWLLSSALRIREYVFLDVPAMLTAVGRMHIICSRFLDPLPRSPRIYEDNSSILIYSRIPLRAFITPEFNHMMQQKFRLAMWKWNRKKSYHSNRVCVCVWERIGASVSLPAFSVIEKVFGLVVLTI